MGALRKPVKHVLIGITTALIGAGGFLAAGGPPAAADVAPVAQRSDTAVTADALPTVQINGVVWDQVIVGDTVYAGGEFTSARPAGSPAGTNETPRSNLLAYNIKTGALVTTFAPTVNAQVKSLAVSPDGTKLYIAGSFTSVNGVNRYRVASFTVATGALTSFAPAPNSTVNSIAVTDTAVYAGGVFSKIGATGRGRLAAFNPTSGALLGWAPVADATVQAVLPTPDKSRVIVAGSFANLNGSTATGLGAIDATTAATLPWTANTVVRNYGTQAAMLKLRTDGSTVYAVGYWFGGPQGNFEGVLAAEPNSGDVKWLSDCHGDTYDVTPMNDTVYAVSHWHYCSNVGGFPDTNPRKIWYRGNAMTKAAVGTVAHNGQGGYFDFYGQPAPAMVNWFPTIDSGTYTGQSQGAWSTASNSQYLVLGGEFPAVNGTKQQGLVRFAVPSQAPKQQGPREAGAAFNPTVLAIRPDQARIKWTANYDRDDQVLTYTLNRIGTTLPIYTTTVTAQFWNRPGLSFTDTGLTPGQTYKYRVSAADPDGNTVSSEIVPITMPTTEDSYVKQVLTDGAADYWRMNGTGGTQPDYAGALDLTNDTGTATAPGGALTAADAALSFNGTGSGQAGTTNAVSSSNVFSAEAWFKTTTTSGGKILGFGGSSTGNSGSYDRHVYMDNSGKVLFGVYPGSVQTVSGSKAYNDGQWHHAVAELSGAGMVLYMDGIKVGSNPSVTTGQDYAGYWRVGGDNINGWTNQPSSFYFNGTIDEVAIYPTALTGSQVRDHYTKSGRTAAVPASPTDTYGKAVYQDEPALYWRLNDAPGSTALDASPNQSNGTFASGVSRQTASTVSDPPVGATFDGVNGTVGSNQQFTNPVNFSEEIWFNTTTTAGGKLMGFGDQQTANSGNYDRHIFMTNAGQLTFGTYTGGENTTTSADAYNDGKWHHMVATQSTTDGLKLYVDGNLVGTNGATGAQSYTGYWRVGGDSSWCCSNYLNGSLDEAAVYTTVLTPAQVTAHYKASPAAISGGPVNQNPTVSFTADCTELACSFDSSGSSDPDGTIASYAWDFGDGSTSSNANPSHTYGAAKTYTVKLKATDKEGASTTTSKSLTVALIPNKPPVAAFTSTCVERACSFDGSGSSDPDGSVTGYSWDFKDGGTSTSATPSHTFTADGTYAVTLTVTDNRGDTTSLTKNVVVAANANVKPTAAFTKSCTNLVCSFDGSTSTDGGGGTIATYAWDFGDNTAAGSGKTPDHTYAAAGAYTVKLTVTDNQGLADTASSSVTVSAAQAGPIAADNFGRTVSRWGSADTGGAWTYSGSTFATNGSTGSITLASPGVSATGYLNSVSARDLDVVADLSVNKMATGSGTYNTMVVRRNGNSDYRATLQELAGGKVKLTIAKTVSGSATTLRQVALTDLTYNAGDKIRVRFQVSGNGTSDLEVKAWRVGSAEPTTSQVITSDSTASLQTEGSFAVISYLANNATNAPVTVSVDNLLITAK